MSSTLGRYLARLLLARFAVLLLGLAALMSILEFLADGDQILASSQAVVWPILHYSFLRLPEILSEMIPVAAILSGLLTFTELARRNELTALQTAGLSRLQLGRALLPVALLIAGFQLGIEDQALPRAVAELRAWGVADYGAEDDAGPMLWLRDGDQIVRIRRIEPGADQLTGVTVFRRDAEGNFLEKIEAETAVYGSEGWVLHGAGRVSADPLSRAAGPPAAMLADQINLDPELLRVANARPKETSLADLLRLIARPDLGTQPVYRYKVWLHERLAGPVTTVVLLMLTVAFGRPFHNRAGRGLLLAAGIAAGFVLWTFDGLLLTFGELGLLPPFLAAWMPPLIFAITAWSIVLHDGRRIGAREPEALPGRDPVEPAAPGAVARRGVALGATVERRWES